jgi:hypothetical protein
MKRKETEAQKPKPYMEERDMHKDRTPTSTESDSCEGKSFAIATNVQLHANIEFSLQILVRSGDCSTVGQSVQSQLCLKVCSLFIYEYASPR